MDGDEILFVFGKDGLVTRVDNLVNVMPVKGDQTGVVSI